MSNINQIVMESLFESDDNGKSEYEMGIEMEKEHSKDPKLLDKIVRDHLKEDPKYYSKLKDMLHGDDD